MFHHLTRPAAIIGLTLAAMTAGCGGGDEERAAIAEDPGVAMRSFSLSSATLSAPAGDEIQLAATWSASAPGSIGDIYYITAHAIPAGSASTEVKDGSRFLLRNCLPSARCPDPSTASCSFDKKRWLSCDGWHEVSLPAGVYTIVAKACYFDAAVVERCHATTSALTVK